MKAISARIIIVVLVTMMAFWVGSPGAPIVAVGAAPTLTAPEEGTTLSSFGTTLTWTNPPDTTQYHLQVIPFNNDGPGVNVHIGSAATSFDILAPPSWYGLLPDMNYTWRVRVSDATAFVDLDDPSWGPWAEGHFRTPVVLGATISPLAPAEGEVVSVLTPSLQWANGRSDVFYYEVQLSKDPSFNTALAMVYSALLRGGVTIPPNSYSVPGDLPLEDNTDYYWRVRPRVQGDGTPVAWSALYTFQTSTSATPLPMIEAISFGFSAADPATCQIPGASHSFTSTPRITGLYYASKYTGSGAVARTLYRDDVPSLYSSSDLAGPSGCFMSSLGAPGGKQETAEPLLPGTYRLLIGRQGREIRSASFTIAPAQALTIGPVTVGLRGATREGCPLSGVSTTFSSGAQALVFRWNSVGSGIVTVSLRRNQQQVVSGLHPITGPADCSHYTVNSSNGFAPGAWVFEVRAGAQVLNSVTFRTG